MLTVKSKRLGNNITGNKFFERKEPDEDEDEWEAEERKRKEDLADRDAFVERMKKRDEERTKKKFKQVDYEAARKGINLKFMITKHS